MLTPLIVVVIDELLNSKDKFFISFKLVEILRCLDIHPDPLEHRAICMSKHMRCERIKYIVICCCSVSFGSLICCL